jgi:hypothetical protein
MAAATARETSDACIPLPCAAVLSIGLASGTIPRLSTESRDLAAHMKHTTEQGLAYRGLALDRLPSGAISGHLRGPRLDAAGSLPIAVGPMLLVGTVLR